MKISKNLRQDKQENGEWLIEFSDYPFRENDMFNCGPLACLVVYSILLRDKQFHPSQMTNQSTWRPAVHALYKSMLEESMSFLVVETGRKKTPPEDTVSTAPDVDLFSLPKSTEQENLPERCEELPSTLQRDELFQETVTIEPGTGHAPSSTVDQPELPREEMQHDSTERTLAASIRQKLPNDVYRNIPAQQELKAANANLSLGIVKLKDNSNKAGV